MAVAGRSVTEEQGDEAENPEMHQEADHAHVRHRCRHDLGPQHDGFIQEQDAALAAEYVPDSAEESCI